MIFTNTLKKIVRKSISAKAAPPAQDSYRASGSNDQDNDCALVVLPDGSIDLVSPGTLVRDVLISHSALFLSSEANSSAPLDEPLQAGVTYSVHYNLPWEKSSPIGQTRPSYRRTNVDVSPPPEQVPCPCGAGNNSCSPGFTVEPQDSRPVRRSSLSLVRPTAAISLLPAYADEDMYAPVACFASVNPSSSDNFSSRRQSFSSSTHSTASSDQSLEAGDLSPMDSHQFIARQHTLPPAQSEELRKYRESEAVKGGVRSGPVTLQSTTAEEEATEALSLEYFTYMHRSVTGPFAAVTREMTTGQA